MNKIKVTAQQRANAIEARDVMWPSVPPENVAKELGFWRDGRDRRPTCGTHACFGGWCAVWPSFRAQGVRVGYGGAPRSVHGNYFSSDVAEQLFGDPTLFVTRQANEWGSDHEIVTRRLNRLIANSVVSA